MADDHISLKVLVDRENDKVIYAESDEDFVDVLFSFLTIPMGTISGLDRHHPPAVGLGCMNNLQESVEKFDEQRLQTPSSKVMLLYPLNGAETNCNYLKLKIEYSEPTGRLGVMDANSIEEKAFGLGVGEIVNLLRYSLISKTPLTETLLKQKPVPELSMKIFSQGSSIRSQMEGDATNQDGKICVKLMVSKSRKIVCYAEAKEDFVNLLFSFLTVPLGYVVKEMQGDSLKRGIHHLYNSVQVLDEEYFKSDHHRAMLTIPKLAPGFSYENQPLGIEEASHPSYYFTSEYTSTSKDGKQSKGFVIGPANFTITDNLFITPLSPIVGVSILKKLQVPFSDIEERIVHVGKEEALRLLVASFVSEAALTNAFILRESKQEQEH